MDARKAGIILYAAAAATMLLATFAGFPPDWKPAGVEEPAPLPSFRPKSLLSGTFAEEFDRFFARQFGFRGFGIRLAHQLEWDLFGTLPRPKGTAIDEGSDHWLYEHLYVSHHVHRYGMPPDEASEFAARMAALRDCLAKRGIPLVVCVAPSKPSVYGEYLPGYAVPSAAEENNTPARDRLVESLRREGVPTVDSLPLFLSWKEEGPLLFSRNGTHWNAYGAQRVFDAIIAAARAQNPSLPPVPTVTGFVDAPPLLTDSDLSALFNIFRYPFEEKTVPYPTLSSLPEPTAKRLRILGVGDSFSFQLADAMGRCGAVESFRFLYYNKADYRFSWVPNKHPRENRPEKFRLPSFSADDFDLDEATRDVDLVLVELNDIFARQRAWDFGTKLDSESDRR